MTTVTRKSVNLQPGAFYRIRDLGGTCPRTDARLLTPYEVIYVRDERICGEGDQHVFAGIWDKGILMRLRMPVDSLKQTEEGLLCENLTTKVIISTKGDGIRRPSITSFINEVAYLTENPTNDPSVRSARSELENHDFYDHLQRLACNLQKRG